VRIGRHGPDAFGWEIRSEGDSIEIHRSTRLFASRVEAMLDAAQAAAVLGLIGVEPVEDENRDGG
jgi:hypothetical protein